MGDTSDIHWERCNTGMNRTVALCLLHTSHHVKKVPLNPLNPLNPEEISWNFHLFSLIFCLPPRSSTLSFFSTTTLWGWLGWDTMTVQSHPVSFIVDPGFKLSSSCSKSKILPLHCTALALITLCGGGWFLGCTETMQKKAELARLWPGQGSLFFHTLM